LNLNSRHGPIAHEGACMQKRGGEKLKKGKEGGKTRQRVRLVGLNPFKKSQKAIWNMQVDGDFSI